MKSSSVRAPRTSPTPTPTILASALPKALNAPALLKATFVIEGPATAEGDYAKNLRLSQERVERIPRELVRHGVSPERLMPVGYGETEAVHPANAVECECRFDRRVMVLRMR